jgi:hypothetical protein
MEVAQMIQIKLRLLELAVEVFRTTPHQFNSVIEVYLDLKKELQIENI